MAKTKFKILDGEVVSNKSCHSSLVKRHIKINIDEIVKEGHVNTKCQ
jgi:hypothetical protein